MSADYVMCAKYFELRYNDFKKNCTLSKLARLLDYTASKFALFSVSDLKVEKFIIKANLHEN